MKGEGTARVHIVGIGDDGPRSLSARAAALVEEAELLVGGERHLSFFPAHRGERLAIKANLAEVARTLDEGLGQGRRAVVLASGDPNFFGIAHYLVSKLPPEAVEIHPNVSAMQLAFAHIKVNWDDAALLSVHGRPVADVVEAARRHAKVGLFTDDVRTPAAVARVLLAAGVPNRRAFVCENLGGEAERVTATDLLTLPGQAFSPLNVLILLEETPGGAAPAAAPAAGARPAGERTLGIPDAAFAQRTPKRGLITKWEVRVVSLARLGLRPDSTVWDIGACTGSVSIEAARLCPAGHVFAVERNEEDMANLRENVARFGAGNVTVLRATAPEGLDAFPDPDAVFIGGTGRRMAEVLAVAAARLRPGGRIVLNLATLDNLAEARAALRQQGLEHEVTMLNVARSRLIGKEEPLMHLESYDPVFIMAAWRPGEGEGPPGAERITEGTAL